MHIEVNRDLDKFKESVVLGLSARQLIYSIIALALGSGIVLLKQSNIDSVRLSETIRVSDTQLEFVKNSQSGTGSDTASP